MGDTTTPLTVNQKIEGILEVMREFHDLVSEQTNLVEMHTQTMIALADELVKAVQELKVGQ